MSEDIKLVEEVEVTQTVKRDGRDTWWVPAAKFSVAFTGAVSHPPVILDWDTKESLSEAEVVTIARAARWALARRLHPALRVEPAEIKVVKVEDGWKSTVRWSLPNGPSLTVTVPSFGSLEDVKDAARKLLGEAIHSLSPEAHDRLRSGEQSAPVPVKRPLWMTELLLNPSAVP
ncbi:hypothetical protein [Azospirillum picis]|uniref:DUF45 domain-containing protein n=1 Tax=Azospirillum picis TaxID=488438 RepID=A0ABU0MUK5_9PROT|nr:hypothetical protein [Azospirillum picis]MBP2303344.1 hypothetical protein [Azospirillum picis]MDQ0537174.1 hypothetical protein [Azospirillum picis]